MAVAASARRFLDFGRASMVDHDVLPVESGFTQRLGWLFHEIKLVPLDT